MISPLIMSDREAGSSEGDIMFIAKILVCSVLTGDCVAIQDITGISISRNACARRQIEMFKDVNGELPQLVLAETYCEKSAFQPV